MLRTLARTLIAALLTTAVLAGCLGPDSTKDAGLDSLGPGASLTLGGQSVQDTAPLYFRGPEIGAGERHEYLLDVQIPDGYWATMSGALEVSLLYDLRDYAWVDLFVTTPGGEEIEAMGWNDYVTLIDTPASGTYTITVKGREGVASYLAVAQLETKPRDAGPARDLLPNLVTLPPTDLTIGSSYTCAFVACVGPYVCAQALGCVPNPVDVGACSAVERVEDQVQRCLRFSNRIGNVGEGPFEVILELPDEALAMAGRGEWTQNIWRSDGSIRTERVGPAAYHVTHGHVHYEGMAHYELFAYDLDAAERLDAVSEGRKVGFCLIDMGLVELGLPYTSYPGQTAGCGLSSNWFDLYWYTLDEQYIDITGLPNGVYELVSTANVLGTAIEADHEDNWANVVFRLTGDEIEILQQDAPYGADRMRMEGL